MEPQATAPSAADPLREAGRLRIQMTERADGGKEFVLPALRNFSEKSAFLLAWVLFTILFGAAILFHGRALDQFPSFIRFFAVEHIYVFMIFLGLIDLVLTIACVDICLRRSRVVVTAEAIMVRTGWLFFRRLVSIPAVSIIEIQVDGNTSVGETVYYDVVVLATGHHPGWMASHFPAAAKPGGSFTENDLRVYNSGGRKIAAATGIKGREEAEWFAAEMRRILGLDKPASAPTMNS